MRAVWPDAPLSAAAFLSLVQERGPIYRETELEQIEGANDHDLPPASKWPQG